MRRPDDELGQSPGGGGSDQARFDVLYREQAPRLRRWLDARVRSREEANDLVQDAFARLLGSGARDGLRQPEAFLNRIVRNLLIDRSRRVSNRIPHVPIDEMNEPSTRATQEDAIELAQMRERYRIAVEALPPRTRQVFVLHRVDGIGYKEIATQLGISIRTVEWHVGEALVRIGKDLGQ
ncbi:RNA polymerase sigma factor [Sphingomonas qomolangmaensis]|uniref:Sigma-70 family RNA polymerase sigma factor n=1 Tax=Sphingomonas qomolangmaensis TaxID=2918765 RepID=A0ABY5L7V8_9SPHN|nr:sigma-70 family RNA polymerase sigma factor [Sphingomonas qomolangmaensis]UUL82522.1 sigma-70 family RNA polymerase sigma factor [Sphingomonas qomolangmaensis]